MSAYLTYQYRLYPTQGQIKALEYYLLASRVVYNDYLKTREMYYEAEGKTLTPYDFFKDVSRYYRPFYAVPNIILRGAVADLDEAFKAFFRRVKNGNEEKGYPKYRRYGKHNTIHFLEFVSIKIDGRRLYVQGVGRIRVRWHREMNGIPKSAHITRKADGWYVSITCEVVNDEPLPETGKSVGIDFGLSALLTTSEGHKVDHPHWYKEAEAKLRRLQRKADRQRRANNPGNFNDDGTVKKGRRAWIDSNNYKATLKQIARQHQKVQRQRQDFIDKLVLDLVEGYDVIAVEDLQILNMVKNKHLSKSILNAAWGYFRLRLEEKAGLSGKAIVLVDPRYTSQTCSQCGQVFAERIGLSTRWVTCDCGMSLDRDHNAALNVLNRAGQVLGGVTWDSKSERAPETCAVSVGTTEM